MIETSRMRRYLIAPVLFLACLSAPVVIASTNALPECPAPTAVERLIKTVRSLFGMFDINIGGQVGSGELSEATASASGTPKASQADTTSKTSGDAFDDGPIDPPMGMPFILDPSG